MMRYIFWVMMLGVGALLWGCHQDRELPTYYPVEINGTDTIFQQIPAFRLLNQEGDTVELKDLEDKILIVDFFFVSCPGICPQLTNSLTRVQKVYKDWDEVHILSFSVDPSHDRPDVLKTYADEYGVITDKWWLMTGEQEEMYQIVTEGFRMPATSEPSDTAALISHSEHMLLVDPQGHFRGFYNGTKEEEVIRLLNDMKLLIQKMR